LISTLAHFAGPSASPLGVTLSVANKPFMLSFVILSAVMLALWNRPKKFYKIDSRRWICRNTFFLEY